jgi:hypothetical protein
MQQVKIFYHIRSLILIDGFTKVTDKDAAVHSKLFEEGILLVILFMLPLKDFTIKEHFSLKM